MIRYSPTIANLDQHRVSYDAFPTMNRSNLVGMNLLPVGGTMSMSQPLPILEQVELFRGLTCESLLDRLPELGRDSAMES